MLSFLRGLCAEVLLRSILLNMKSLSSPEPVADPLANGFLPDLFCILYCCLTLHFYSFISHGLRSGHFNFNKYISLPSTQYSPGSLVLTGYREL